MIDYPWLISAIIAWVIFLLLVDWSRLKYTVWGGVIALILQFLVDTGAIKLHLYRIDSVLSILGSPVFFTFGVVFAIGILFAQTLPESRLLQALNILLLVALFFAEEYLYVQVGVLEYLNWSHPASIFTDLLVFTSLSWLVNALGLNRAGRSARGGLKI